MRTTLNLDDEIVGRAQELTGIREKTALLADTSVWVAHLRWGLPPMVKLLNERQVLSHLFIIGELACGHVRQRSAILQLLRELPQAVPASNDEVLRMIEDQQLWGTGIGWVDCHLLASAMLTPCRMWTRDQRLYQAASDCELA